MADLVDSLRLQIEQEHAKAIEALKVLSGYLNKNGHVPSGRQQSTDERPTSAKRGRGPSVNSFRTRVLNAIAQDWATVAKIMDMTGLEVKQVRGVVNAPGMDKNVERRDGPNGTEYRVIQSLGS